jgi:hypothetical protein
LEVEVQESLLSQGRKIRIKLVENKELNELEKFEIIYEDGKREAADASKTRSSRGHMTTLARSEWNVVSLSRFGHLTLTVININSN